MGKNDWEITLGDDEVIFVEILEIFVHSQDTLSMESEHGLKVSRIKNKIKKFVALFDGNIALPLSVSQSPYRKTCILC